MEGRSLSRDKSQEDITLLGKKNVKYHYDYCPEILETFENRHPDNDYWVKFNCPEFTALCPITGQPDYATIYISYIPGRRMVESKSLKLYLVSFRNHGDFHEDVVNVIMKDLIRLMDPKYIEVWGKFLPRQLRPSGHEVRAPRRAPLHGARPRRHGQGRQPLSRKSIELQRSRGWR